MLYRVILLLLFQEVPCRANHFVIGRGDYKMRFFASVSSDLRLFPGDYSHIYEGEWSQVVFNGRARRL